MKTIYLENTNNYHNKFYHMIENKDGVSFTASWGRIGTTGRTQIYGMYEWDKIYTNKISKGYKVSTSGIQGMSVAQRKKQGITTVQPLVQPKKAKKIHYDVEVDHSHMNKLRILQMTMENWTHNDGKSYALDSMQGRVYEADLHKVNELEKTLSHKRKEELLTKQEMVEMNFLFKYYGGIRKQGFTN